MESNKVIIIITIIIITVSKFREKRVKSSFLFTSSTTLASHAGVFRGARFSSLKTPAWEATTTREIWYFHVVVVQWRQRNLQKSVMHLQSCCFANLNLLFFCRSRWRRRRRCLSSLKALWLHHHYVISISIGSTNERKEASTNERQEITQLFLKTWRQRRSPKIFGKNGNC